MMLMMSYIHSMYTNKFLKYLALTATAGAMSYLLYRTAKSVNEIDRLLKENYGDNYSTDYFPYEPVESDNTNEK